MASGPFPAAGVVSTSRGRHACSAPRNTWPPAGGRRPTGEPGSSKVDKQGSVCYCSRSLGCWDASQLLSPPPNMCHRQTAGLCSSAPSVGWFKPGGCVYQASSGLSCWSHSTAVRDSAVRASLFKVQIPAPSFSSCADVAGYQKLPGPQFFQL